MAIRYKVKFDTWPNIIMANWCSENCRGKWFGTDWNRIWYFDLEEDAVAFKLRWV